MVNVCFQSVMKKSMQNSCGFPEKIGALSPGWMSEDVRYLNDRSAIANRKRMKKLGLSARRISQRKKLLCLDLLSLLLGRQRESLDLCGFSTERRNTLLPFLHFRSADSEVLSASYFFKLLASPLSLLQRELRKWNYRAHQVRRSKRSALLPM